MKKIKLLAPILSISTLSSVVMPLVGCSCNKSKGETINAEVIDSPEGVKIKEYNIQKGKESTITLTIPSGKEIETLEIKVGNKVLTKDDYTIDANNKITIKADSVTGGNVTVKVTLKGSSPEEKTLKTLTIKNEASKKSFEVGETFSSEGLVLLATYKDNTTEDITTGYTAKLGEQDLKNYVFKNTDKGTDKTVTITFKDKECTYKINVNDKTYSETVIIDDQGNEYVADMDTICATTGNIKSKDSNLDIPRNEFNYQVVLGKNTTTINDNFLYGCSVFNNGDADGITTKPFIFPDSVTTIGSSFLQNCSKFNQQITFPNNTNFTTIGSNFLSSCKKFNNSDVENIATKQFSIPDSVTTIGENFLYYCEKFNQQITFPTNKKVEYDTKSSIIRATFANCSSLEKVTLSKNSYATTYLTGSDFLNCTNLTTFEIPSDHPISLVSYDGVENKALVAKKVNTNEQHAILLGIINPPTDVDLDKLGTLTDYPITEIGQYAFRSIPISSINISSNITSIGSYAFSSCASLSSITLPSTLTSIGSYAFSSCTSLASITLPSTLTTLTQELFSGCKALASITIPSTVTSIQKDAFKNCSALLNVTVDSATIATIDNPGQLFNKITGKVVKVPEGTTVGTTISNNYTKSGSEGGYDIYTAS